MVEVFERRGHSVTTTDNYLTAHTDMLDVTNSSGAQFACKVCHNECDILCQQKGRHPHMCSACQLYRGNLHAMRWQFQQCDIPSRISHNSHANIHFLNAKEIGERLKNVQQQKRSVTAKVQKLEEKMKIVNEVVLSEPEVDVVNDLIKDASDTVHSFPKDSAQYILWIMHCGPSCTGLATTLQLAIMHLSIVCPTSPCTGIGGAKGGCDWVVYFNPTPLGLYWRINPHFRKGSQVGIWHFSTNISNYLMNITKAMI